MRYARHNSFSRFIPILLVIVITVVAIAAVLAIGQSLLGGGDNTEQQPRQQSAAELDREALLSTDTNRSVRLTVRGPIIAQEKFRSYQVEISPTYRRMTAYEGYLDKQLDEKRFENNSRAYEELVYALEKRKMMEGRQLPEDKNDLRGVCANGRVYKFETVFEGQTVKTLWTSDCGGAKGSATANVNDIMTMFLNQIPEGKKFASSIGLRQEDTFFNL